MKTCFECDKTEDLHKHHVVPKFLGGKRTVFLCPECHGKVHGVDFMNHRNLIKLGQKNSDKKIGRPTFGSQTGELEILKLIRSLRRKVKGRKRLSFAVIAEKLNQDGIPSRMGKPWQPEVVRRILMRKKAKGKQKETKV